MRLTSGLATGLVGVLLGLLDVGCFGPDGHGATRDASADGGGDGSTGECGYAGHCRLIDERCCGCGPPSISDPVRAVPIDSDDFGRICDQPCVGCPELVSPPVTVVADCVEGTCAAVDLREQPYTACEVDSDCELRAVSCCGWCGLATMDNSYAVQAGSEFDPCPHPVACPDVECPPPDIFVEAFCTDERFCFVRPPSE